MKALLLLVLTVALQDRDDLLKKDIAEAITRLGSERYTESYLALVELREIGRPAVPALLAELGKDNAAPAVKMAACEILGAIRAPESGVVARLTKLLEDDAEYGVSVASAAARALGMIGDPAAVPALVKTLTSKRADLDKLLKYECIHALGVFRAKEAEEALRKSLEDKKQATVVTGDQDAPLIAAAAAAALGRLRSSAAVEDLGDLLTDTTRDPASGQTLGVHAARALRRILAAEFEGKDPKDEPRAGVLSGAADDVNKTLEAWKTWWDERTSARKITVTEERIAEIAKAVEAYHKAHGKHPVLVDQLKKDPDIKEGYPEKGYYQGELRDGWKRPILLRVPGTGGAFDVYSYGKDGRAWGGGSDADLYNHDGWKEAIAARTKEKMEAAGKAIKAFHDAIGAYPKGLHDLVAPPTWLTPEQREKFPEKGFSQGVPQDGFGNFFIYRAPGTGGEAYDLVSPGADRVEGGEGVDADVWNHDKRPEKKDAEEKKEGDAGKDGK